MSRNQLLSGILILSLACRLYHINFPVAGFQGWRQADTAAMARNYYENGFRFMYPQIDWGGDSPGYVETEFPIYSFLISLLYALFSPADAWGRLLSIAFSLVTICGIYALVKKYLGGRTALWAAFIYAILPLNVFYSRAVMPESMMLMSTVLGLYYFSEWLDRGRVRDYLPACLFLCLAILIKPPTLYIGLPLLFLAWNKHGARAFLRRGVWGVAIIVLTPVVLWYRHAHGIFLASGLTFGIFDYGTGKWGSVGPLLTFKFYNDVFFKSIAERHLTYAGFIPFVAGLFLRRQTEREKVFDWWLIAVVVYFLIVARGNQVHEHYQLPFIIPAVVYIAKLFSGYSDPGRFAASWKTKRFSAAVFSLCLLSMPVLGFLRYSRYMDGERTDSSLFRLAGKVQSCTGKGDLVVAMDRADPVILYRCGRKGWHSHPEELSVEFLQSKRSRGAKYLLGTKDFFDEGQAEAIIGGLLRRYSAVENNDEYFILRLSDE